MNAVDWPTVMRSSIGSHKAFVPVTMAVCVAPSHSKFAWGMLRTFSSTRTATNVRWSISGGNLCACTGLSTVVVGVIIAFVYHEKDIGGIGQRLGGGGKGGG